MNDNLWYKLSRVIVKAGNMPFPVTDTLIELLQNVISEEEADFIIKVYNRKPNMNINEIKSKIDMTPALQTAGRYGIKEMTFVLGFRLFVKLS